MPLSDARVRNAKPKKKMYKLFDGGGLHLRVTPPGGKLWRFQYRFGGKEKELSVGKYPHVGLKDARNRRDTMKKQLAFGKDPSRVRKDRKRAKARAKKFEDVAREWHYTFRSSWEPKTAENILSRLEQEIFPEVGNRPIDEVEPPELLTILERIRDEGHLEKANRILQHLGKIFQYAIAHGQASWDPTEALGGAIPSPPPHHYPTITEPQKVGELVRTIDDLFASYQVQAALEFLLLTFVRPGELRHALWGEVSLNHKEWRIPAFKMKRRAPHIVPLSKQAVFILEKLHSISGDTPYLFPSVRSAERPISENTINKALRRMGYNKNELVAHSFRSIASTRLYENNWGEELIEPQLAHKVKGEVRGAYDFSQRLEQRREMMQGYADYLDTLCNLAYEEEPSRIYPEPINPFSPRLLHQDSGQS